MRSLLCLWCPVTVPAEPRFFITDHVHTFQQGSIRLSSYRTSQGSCGKCCPSANRVWKLPRAEEDGEDWEQRRQCIPLLWHAGGRKSGWDADPPTPAEAGQLPPLWSVFPLLHHIHCDARLTTWGLDAFLFCKNQRLRKQCTWGFVTKKEGQAAIKMPLLMKHGEFFCFSAVIRRCSIKVSPYKWSLVSSKCQNVFSSS